MTELMTNLLLGIPFSIFANLATDGIKKISTEVMNQVFPQKKERLKQLFLNSFFQTLEDHQKHYDENARQVTQQFKKQIKKFA